MYRLIDLDMAYICNHHEDAFKNWYLKSIWYSKYSIVNLPLSFQTCHYVARWVIVIELMHILALFW